MCSTNNLVMFSSKKVYVKGDGWHGAYRYVNAIVGANDTGTFSDSPCPTNVCKNELRRVTFELRKLGIKYRTLIGTSSNLFCVSRQIVVSDKDISKAREVVTDELLKDTRLLYRIEVQP